MPKIKISVNQWNSMIVDEQEKYIIDNNIEICYSTGIHDMLTRGFGFLDQYGFWEYQCKTNGMPKLIRTWDELKECKSETHILEIEDCYG